MRPSKLLRLAVVALGLAPSSPGAASGWWNREWSARKLLRIDTGAAGAQIADPIGTTAVLVRLHVGDFDFESAKEDGSDLRFVAGDGRTVLKHHVERFDPLLGEALVWVGMPDLRPGAQTDFWIYYRNPKAPPAEDARGTYDPAAVLVYHFGERGQPPRDSSPAGNHASGPGAGIDGAMIGRGIRLDGTAALPIPPSPSLAWGAGASLTWSAWARPAAAEGAGVIFARRDGPRALVIGIEGGRPYAEVADGADVRRASAPAAIPAGEWHHLAVTAGQALALHVDGVPVARVAAPVPALDTPAFIGGMGPPGSASPRARKTGSGRPAPGFRGDLDEVQLARVERPPGFLRAAVQSQGDDPSRFLVTGEEEVRSSWASGTLGVIVRSVTFDGWVVIGVLAVMAAVSWMVMIEKALYLRGVRRANARFLERFRTASQDLRALLRSADGASPLGDEAALGDSPLLRIFHAGVGEIRAQSKGGRALSAEAVAAVRSGLEGALSEEADALNRRMVLLTIAISGGPFLGLLGTVVGVMITFAAIAAAGDVNVTAIAPGIAAALVATVAGLAVAIPALFGYNWLLTRIKSLHRSLQVFTDELVTKAAAALGTASAGDPRAEGPGQAPGPDEARRSTEAGRPVVAAAG
jgi:biopolymer transport protein ExbB